MSERDNLIAKLRATKCDRCGKAMTFYGEYRPFVMANELVEKGWIKDIDGKAVCPDCKMVEDIKRSRQEPPTSGEQVEVEEH